MENIVKYLKYPTILKNIWQHCTPSNKISSISNIIQQLSTHLIQIAFFGWINESHLQLIEEPLKISQWVLKCRNLGISNQFLMNQFRIHLGSLEYYLIENGIHLPKYPYMNYEIHLFLYLVQYLVQYSDKYWVQYWV